MPLLSPLLCCVVACDWSFRFAKNLHRLTPMVAAKQYRIAAACKVQW